MNTTLKVLCTHCGKLIPEAESDAHCATHETTPIPAVASDKPTREQIIADLRQRASYWRITHDDPDGVILSEQAANMLEADAQHTTTPKEAGHNVSTNPAMQDSRSERDWLIALLDNQSLEIAEIGHCGWGNTMAGAADMLRADAYLLQRAQADALDARITWRSGEEIPTLTEGDDQGFIVCVQRAPSGKRYVFGATYANKFEIEWDSFAYGEDTTASGNRWQAEVGEEHDHATGWFVEDATDEPRYSPLLSADDQLVAWAEFPKAETVDAALRTSSPDPVGGET